MPRSNYDDIGAEYYDARHVTSRNFDTTTATAIAELAITFPRGKVLELGAGRGRSGEFLGVNPARVVQLDSSQVMFDLPDREDCLLKVLADACCIPLASKQFAVVVGFLADPFFGLDCISEAYRMLEDGGRVLFTLPTFEWAAALRESLGLDLMTTRFLKIGTEDRVLLPSLVHPPERIQEMLSFCGFGNVEITNHKLPRNVQQISPDIQSAAAKKGISVHDLPIIHVVRASR